MIRFVLGRTGSGKTRKILAEIKQLLSQKKAVTFFVPEQQLFSAERELLSSIPNEDAGLLTLTSFTKLCDQLEDLYGGRSHTSLTKAASALLMWLNLRELTGLLESYKTVPSGDVTLTRMMLDTAKELTGNGITPLQLEQVAETANISSPLAGKLRDIALVMSSYVRLTEEICGSDPADRLLRTAEKIRTHGYFEGATVFIDSFTSFTAQEYTLLSLMLSQAASVTVTLALEDPFCSEPQFDSLKDTYRRLNGLAATAGRERFVEKCVKDHDSGELALLEKTLWDFSADPHTLPVDKQGHIHMITAPNAYEEAEAAALHILELANQGISYGEMAVVVRDMTPWRGILDVALDQYHIPYFLSEKTDLNTKPAARLLLMALRCIGRGYQIADVMSLCKTGLCGVSLRDLDYFEEYTDTWHLSGKRMTETTWSMNPDGYTTDWSKRGKVILDAANRVREKVMVPLSALEIGLRTAATLTDQCRALYDYLGDLSVKSQLSDMGKTYLSLGKVREAGETVRLWSFINEALSTLATISSVGNSDHPLTPDELSGALSLIYAETDIGSVPARHDCITVGTADTLRVENIKASLLLGLNEGEFPGAIHQSGLFSEQDKAFLCNNGVEFASREDMMTSEELLYVYKAMTKATEQLYLSRSLYQNDGKELSPSAAFTRVSYLFPHLKIIPYTSRYLKEGSPSVYRPVSDDILPTSRVYALLGEEMWLSRSKLQRYAYCPYSYFGSYILQLREKISAQVDQLLSGLFLHYVLEKFLRGLISKDGAVTDLSDEDVEKIADDIMEAYIRSINRSPDILKQGRFLHTFERLREIALVLLRDMMAELKQSSFIPVGVEWDTHGYTPEDPLPLILPLHKDQDEDLPTGVEKGASVRLMMGGVIDRVDIYRTEDHKTVYIRVIDYKSSRHELSERTVTEDMDIQLLLYLFTLCSPQNRHLFADENGALPDQVLPAEAMYLSPKEDTDSGDISAVRTGLLLEDEEVIRAVSRDVDPAFLPQGIKIAKDGALSGKALCSPERIQALEELLHQTVRSQAGEMYSGVAHRTPSPDGCQYCRMRATCPIAANSPKF